MDLQPKYINPFTDFGFKRLFGEETTLKEPTGLPLLEIRKL